MKILMILHSQICGGAEVHARLLMTGLQARGHEIIYAGPRGSWLATQAAADGIEVLRVPLSGVFDVYSLARLVQKAIAADVDLVHGHLVRGTHYATLAARFSGRPSVATAHATNSYKRFHRVDRVVAVSAAVRDFLVAHGVQPARVHTIHHGVPDHAGRRAQRAAVRAGLGLAEGDQALCMVARFVRDKGQDLLVEAVQRLGRDDLRLFFIGETEGDWYRQIRSQVEAARLAERVHFLGHREDVPDLLGAMDLFLAPSRREALSLSIIEAAAMSLPVVAARVGGIPEVIVDRQTGLLVPVDDSPALAEAIGQLLDDPALAERLARAGRERYLRQFSLDAMLDGHEAVYREALQARRP